MSAERVKRKLTAILSADVKGYSRLVGEDELGAIRTLTAYREVMTGLIQNHQGRVVGTAGDSVLAEFASVVDTVQCAVEVQKELKTRNADLPEGRRMEFRIGINLGDVVEEGEDILGDGVNIASRVESLAEAGGICISGIVYDQVKKKLALGYEYLGEQKVKNIEEPVRVYRVLIEPGVMKAKKGLRLDAKGKRSLALGILAVCVMVVAVAVWRFYLRPTPPPVEVASKDKMAFPLPDKPSIAVLPFVNMSEDPKQEFFSDGMTEAIINALSKISDLFVISRQSTFSYKGKPVKVKQVSEELGVRYVLEGSVQRSGDRVRITAQLIDALSGHHLWSERYERDLKDIFAVQDEITVKILTATRVKLTLGEQASTTAKYFKGNQGLDCYLKYLEGGKYVRYYTIEDNRVAHRIAEEIIAMCPENPAAYVFMTYVYMMEYYVMAGSGKPFQESIERGIEMAQKALAMDDTIGEAHALLGHLYLQKREFDKAIAEGERAVALDPTGETVCRLYAMSLQSTCRFEEAIPVFQKAIRLNPFASASAFLNFGHALWGAGRLEEALSAYKKVLQLSPNDIWAHVRLAGMYSSMGREKEARAEVAEVLRINPKFSLDIYAKALPYKDQAVIDKLINDCRKAGLM